MEETGEQVLLSSAQETAGAALRGHSANYELQLEISGTSTSKSQTNLGQTNEWLANEPTAWNGFSVCSSLWSLVENLCTDSVLQSTGKVSLCQRASQRAIGMRMT